MFASCCYPSHPPSPKVSVVFPSSSSFLGSLSAFPFPSPSAALPSSSLISRVVGRRVLFDGSVCNGWGPAFSSATLHYISKYISKYISHALFLLGPCLDRGSAVFFLTSASLQLRLGQHSTSDNSLQHPQADVEIAQVVLNAGTCHF